MHRLRFILTASLLCACILQAAPPTVGQYEIRRRTATGYDSYGVTLANGQAIGQTAGIPAAITIGGGGGATTWGLIEGTLADQLDLKSALDAKQATITDGSLTIARTAGLQAALDAKLSIATAAGTYQLIIGDGDLTIARTAGLQAALDAKLSIATAASTYEPKFTALSLAKGGFGSNVSAASGYPYFNGLGDVFFKLLLPPYSFDVSADVKTFLEAVDAAAMRTALGSIPLTSISGLGSNVPNALAIDIGSAGAPVIYNGAGGTPSSINLTNGTALPLTTGVSGDLPFSNIAQASAASKLLGRGSASGAGDFQEITLGSGLSMSGTTLSASGSSGTGVYRNLTVKASEMIPRVTNGPLVNSSESSTNKVNYDTLDFDPGTTQYAQVWVRMPDEWDAGTVKAKITWLGDSGSGDVVWKVSAVARGDNETVDAAQGTAQSVTDTLLSSNVCVTSATAAITAGGTPAAGKWLIFEISRDTASGSDTYGGNARLIGITVQYNESTTPPSAW